ncbi:uracil-DNA glycosylase [Methylotuvimicrobium buryatense]|uniref:Type-4 uracil-DNA glycosylase n=1 Tax=Methylotuvimicrobium buryatense TaxID=95641 RepID=A0A4P9UM80_METBY|nr:uracil-DNA glycosylase [Methylotuvimicrobium buryatense]
MLDTEIRLHYLKAIGIDVWVSRQAPVGDRINSGVSDFAAPQTAVSALLGDVQKTATPVAPDLPLVPEVEAQPKLSDSKTTWADLQNEVSECRQCTLCESRTQTVFGSGSASSGWMVVGEAPGESEDRQGEPFVGRAGQLLTEMLRAIGLKRDDVFITNILKCRPPNNRDPLTTEVEACSDYLHRQIAWLKPKIILAVGRVSAQNLLKTDKNIGQLRGTVHSLDGIPLVVVYHPAYLLRSPLEKRKAWQDLQLAIAKFDEIKG